MPQASAVLSKRIQEYTSEKIKPILEGLQQENTPPHLLRFQLINDVLYYKDSRDLLFRLVIPEDKQLRLDILHNAHDGETSVTSAHASMTASTFPRPIR